MELICLDTSILIDHRRSKNKSNSLLFQLSKAYNFAITSVTVFELWKGDNSGEDAYWTGLFSKMTLLDFDFESAKIAGEDFLELKKAGLMIDIEDILIASIAKRHQLPIASNNYKHFQRIPNLQLVTLP